MALRPLPVRRIKALIERHLRTVSEAPKDEARLTIAGVFTVDTERSAGASAKLGEALPEIAAAGGEISFGRTAGAEWTVEIVLLHPAAAPVA